MIISLYLVDIADEHRTRQFTGTTEECRQFAISKGFSYKQSSNVFGYYYVNENGDCLMPDLATDEEKKNEEIRRKQIEAYTKTPITYGQLEAIIQRMTYKQRKSSVTLMINGEYLGIDAIYISKFTDVLDEGQPYLLAHGSEAEPEDQQFS